MFPISLFLAAILSMLIAATAFAKTMYVTDVFWITLRTGPSNEHKVIATQKSCDEVKILEEKDDWVKVRLKNGKEGFVLKRYLTSDVPQPFLVGVLQGEVENLKKEVSSFREAEKHLKKAKSELESSLSSREKEFAKVKRDYEELKSGAAGYIMVKELKDKLEVRNKDIESQVDSLLIENRQLKREKNSFWFASGAVVLLIGWFLGLIMGRVTMRRRRDYIKVDL